MKKKQNDLLELIMSNKAKEIQLLDKLNQDEINKQKILMKFRTDPFLYTSLDQKLHIPQMDD